MLNTFSIKPPSISKINSLFLYIFVGITNDAVFLLSFVPLSLQSLGRQYIKFVYSACFVAIGIQNKQVPNTMIKNL